MKLQKLFLANWRSKLIALFFSVSIWFVAYQSEVERTTLKYWVRFRPREDDTMALVGVRKPQQKVSYLAEEGEHEVEVTIEGPREQVEELRAGEGQKSAVEISVEKEDTDHEFKQENFGFPKSGVSITGFQPEKYFIQQSEIEERVIPGLSGIVEVANRKPEDKVNIKVGGPEAGLQIRGPKSILDEERVTVKVTVSVNYQGRVDGLFDLRLVPDKPKVRQTVQILKNFNLERGEEERWVWFTEPVKIQVKAVLEESLEQYSVERARLLFQLPLTPAVFKVSLKDVPLGTETIPVALKGSRVQIEQIRELPEITLIVPPPTELDAEKGGTFTFLEGDLKVKGFPEVEVLRHESRKERQAAFWSYEISVPLKKGSEEE